MSGLPRQNSSVDHSFGPDGCREMCICLSSETFSASLSWHARVATQRPSTNWKSPSHIECALAAAAPITETTSEADKAKSKFRIFFSLSLGRTISSDAISGYRPREKAKLNSSGALFRSIPSDASLQRRHLRENTDGTRRSQNTSFLPPRSNNIARANGSLLKTGKVVPVT